MKTRLRPRVTLAVCTGASVRYTPGAKPVEAVQVQCGRCRTWTWLSERRCRACLDPLEMSDAG